MVKTEHVENTRKLIKEIRAQEGQLVGEKVAKSIRSDNEAVFSGKMWRNMLLEEEVRGWCPVPYTPQQNGVIERYMRTLASNVRACLIGVALQLWCFCAEYIAWTWNRIPRTQYARAPRFNGLAPEDVRMARGYIPERGTSTHSDQSGVDQLDGLLVSNEEESLIQELKDPSVVRRDFVIGDEDLFPVINVGITEYVHDTDEAKYYCSMLTANDICSTPQVNKPEIKASTAEIPSEDLSTGPDTPTAAAAPPSKRRSGAAAGNDKYTFLKPMAKSTPSPLSPSRDAYSRFKKVMHPFGVMAFVKNEPSGHLQKWAQKWVKMVFLGYSTHSSGWLFGWYTRTRSATKMRFHTIVSRSAKFTSFKVKNLEWVSVDSEKKFADLDPFSQQQCDEAPYHIWEPDVYGPHRRPVAQQPGLNQVSGEPSPLVPIPSPEASSAAASSVNAWTTISSPSMSTEPVPGVRVISLA